MWERAYKQIEAKLAEQKVDMQRLTDRCCMLEDRLQLLEEGHNEGSAPTMVADQDQKGKKGRGKEKNWLQWQLPAMRGVQHYRFL